MSGHARWNVKPNFSAQEIVEYTIEDVLEEKLGHVEDDIPQDLAEVCAKRVVNTLSLKGFTIVKIDK